MLQVIKLKQINFNQYFNNKHAPNKIAERFLGKVEKIQLFNYVLRHDSGKFSLFFRNLKKN